MSEVVCARTFFDSAGRLDNNDRARVFDFLGKFQADPSNPGISLERVNRARDPGMWSARITQSLRAIVHQAGPRYSLLYAGQHEDAYTWAERRTVSPHPVTGSLQLVESSEEVERELRAAPPPKASVAILPADRWPDNYLLSLGVPPEWLPTIRLAHDDDQMLRLCARLPEEVGERLLALAAGELVPPPAPTPPDTPVARQPDAQQRFYVVGDAADLADVLNKPFATWIRFLHPSQRSLVEGRFGGPVKVTGSAGTGKTVVAMHRARHLARQGQRVLLTSFVTTLCRNIERNLHALCNADERSRISVDTIHGQALKLVQEAQPTAQPVEDNTVSELLALYQAQAGEAFSVAFLDAEWEQVVQPQGITTWEQYRDARRTGRGRALNARDRKAVWAALGTVHQALETSDRYTWSGICRRACELIEAGQVASPFDAVIVDELQDLNRQELRFARALSAGAPENLMLAGDAGQRIYQGSFSLRELGIDVRGRSRVLRVNYRTTDQIRRLADRLLGDIADDLDGGDERRRAHSLLRGPEPTLRGFASAAAHDGFLLERVKALLAAGLAPSDVAVFARTARLHHSIQDYFKNNGVPVFPLSRDNDPADATGINFGSMHRAKGLEFKVVFAARCDRNALPLPAATKGHEDPADEGAAIARERALLYVCITRARDEAIVTWVGNPSRFLEPLLPG